MSSPQQPPKACPVCGIAMVASHSDDGRTEHDVFTCYHCDFVLRLSPPPAPESTTPDE